MAKVEPAHQKCAELDYNWRFGHQNNVRWPKKFGYFFGNRWKLVRNGSFSPMFLIHTQLWLKWSLSTKNEHNWTTIDDLVTKTMFGDRKNSDTFFGNR